MGTIEKELAAIRRMGDKPKTLEPVVVQDNFQQAFDLFADQTDIPESIQVGLCGDMRRHINDPRKAAKAVEYWTSDEDWLWEEGLEFLRNCGNKKGTFKQQAALFNRCVSGKYYVLEQFKRAARAKTTPRYMLLSKGTVLCECPVHSGDEGKFFRADDIYWITHPLRESVFCHCHVRAISQREADRLVRRGPPLAKQQEINPETGLPTGHLISKWG